MFFLNIYLITFFNHLLFYYFYLLFELLYIILNNLNLFYTLYFTTLDII